MEDLLSDAENSKEKPPVPISTAAAREIREQEDRNIRDWLEGMGAQTPIKIQLYRVTPKVWRGQTIEGMLCNYTDPISEDDIREEHGGGTYAIKLHKPDNKGVYRYFISRQVKISGPPKVAGTVDGEAGNASSSAETHLASRAMDALLQTNKEERNRGTGFDPKMIEVVTAPLMQQIRMQEERMSSMSKPDTSFQEKMIGHLHEDSSRRLESLMAQHSSELREIRETGKQEIARVHDFYKTESSNRERQFDRELSSMKQGFEGRLETQKMAYEARIDGLKSDVSRSDRELTKAETEVEKLREKKDKGPMEMAKELAGFKEAFADLGLGEKEEPEVSTWEKIIGSDVVKDTARAVAERFVNGPGSSGETPKQDPFAAMPVGVPHRLPDGRVVVKQPNGQVALMPAPKKKPRREATAPAKRTPAETALDPVQAKLAIPFIETAIRNNVSPEEFAATARTMVPVEIRDVLKQKGVDHFLEVAKPDETSPMLTQNGRNFLRKVAKTLLET